MSDITNEIVTDNNDCLEEATDNSVDFVITDLPYFVDTLDSNWDYKIIMPKNTISTQEIQEQEVEAEEEAEAEAEEEEAEEEEAEAEEEEAEAEEEEAEAEEEEADEIVIINNDCLEVLKEVKDNSIDCVITDPPYFIDKLDNKWDSKKVSKDSNSHIKHLPKGMKFDKKQVKKLYDFYLELSTILIKKLKPGGYFLSFSSPRLYHSIAMACEIAGFEIRDMINWTYTQSMPKGMSVNHVIENMDMSTEEKEKLKKEYKNFKTPMIRSCFEPICVAMKPIGKLTFIKNELSFKTGLLDFSQKVGIDNDRVPANIMTTEEFNLLYDKNFMVSKPSKKEKGKINTHITIKPLALIEHLVKLFSKEHSLVVDSFLGSGTTALACKNTRRKCLGIEKNKEYYEISLKRTEI